MIKNIHTSLFEQGKIKIGMKGQKKRSQKGTEYQEAVKLDFFVITTLEKDGTPEGNFKIDTEAMKGLDVDPTTIPVEFLYDDIDLNFPTCYAMFNDSGIFCKGDGEKAVRDGKEIVCDPNTCQFFLSKKCKISGILLCRLPHIKNLMSVYKFRTHSWNSVKNILAALQYIQTLTGGIIAGLPFELRLEVKPTKHGLVKIVNLAFPGDQTALAEALEKEVSRRNRLNFDIHRVEETARAVGITEDTDDPSDVKAEFFPDEEPHEPKTRQQEQTEIEARLNSGYAKIEKLWQEHNINEYEQKASIKKHFHCDSLRECRDLRRLLDYYKAHKVQYAQKQAEAEPAIIVKDDTDQINLNFVRQWLGDKEADMFKRALLENDTDRQDELIEEARMNESVATQ